MSRDKVMRFIYRMIEFSCIDVTFCSLSLLEHLVGERGCKGKNVSSETGCTFRIIKNEKKIHFRRNRTGRIHAAINMVLDSLIEFVNDENATGKLLCESHNVTGEPAKIQLHSVVQKLDPTSRKGTFLWAVSIDLPFHEQTGQYHGDFLKNRMKEIKLENCQLHLYGGEFGYKLKFPGMRPYVFIYGRKKADVTSAVGTLRDAMRVHQSQCLCSPSWQQGSWGEARSL